MPEASRRTARTLLFAGAALAVAAAAGTAWAAPDGELAGGQLAIDLELPDGDGDFRPVGESTDEYRQHFNLARCLCGQADPVDPTDPMNPLNLQDDFRVKLTFDPAPPTPVDDEAQIWLGVSCDDSDPARREANCGPEPKVRIDEVDLIRQTVERDFSVAELIDPTATGSCPDLAYDAQVWVVTDPNNDGTFDSAVSQSIAVDTQLPPVPSAFTRAAGAENAISLSWELPETRTEDIEVWQVLCAKADGTPAFAEVPDGIDRDQYVTPTQVCGIAFEPTITEIPVDDDGGDAAAFGPTPDAMAPDAMAPDAMVPDAGTTPDAGPTPTSLPPGLAELDPSYLCAQTAGTASSIRVDGLENGVDYHFVLVAVDRAGNAQGVTAAGTLTPRPVTDFWEDLHDNGSEVDGGFCLLADTYGEGGPGGALTDAMRRFRDETLAGSAFGRWLTAVYYDHLAPLGELARSSVIARIALAIVLLPVVAVALAWHLLTLPGLLLAIAGLILWRRARRRGGLRIAARGWLRPAWAAAGGALAVAAAPGAAAAQTFAPYWDDTSELEDPGPEAIDWHVGVKVGPYVPEIDAQLGTSSYERYFGGYELLPTLEVDRIVWKPPGGQLGIGASIGILGKSGRAFDEMGERADGDYTRFRLLPLAATAIYRLTALDDEYGIPLVPYLRGGLSYYVWWILAPSGDLARVDGDKALGASAGLQGSVGLAIRAERIDPDSAASMRDGGLYHAGFFAEVQLAWVDGFGSEQKLAVGDTTWFAGVSFEF